MTAMVISKFTGDFDGVTCVSQVEGALRKGDVLEAHVVNGDDLSLAALLVVAEVNDSYFAVHLVASAEKGFTEDLVALGDPVYMFSGDIPDECGFFEGGVGLGCARVLGNVAYPVALRLPWLRGAALKKAKAVIDKIAATQAAAAVAPPPFGFTVPVPVCLCFSVPNVRRAFIAAM